MQKRKEKGGLHLQRKRKSKKRKKGKERAWKRAEKKKERRFPVSGLKKREKERKKKIYGKFLHGTAALSSGSDFWTY